MTVVLKFFAVFSGVNKVPPGLAMLWGHSMSRGLKMNRILIFVLGIFGLDSVLQDRRLYAASLL
jgi:hypothetical protein